MHKSEKNWVGDNLPLKCPLHSDPGYATDLTARRISVQFISFLCHFISPPGSDSLRSGLKFYCRCFALADRREILRGGQY